MGRVWRSAAASVLTVGFPTPTGGEAADLDRVNKKAIEAAGLSFILGMRIPDVP
jgi:hypothetical protein